MFSFTKFTYTLEQNVSYWTWEWVPNGYKRCCWSSCWDLLLSDFQHTKTFHFATSHN